MEKKKSINREDAKAPKLAPGMTGVEGLDREATEEEIARGDATQVVKMEYDEYDASEP